MLLLGTLPFTAGECILSVMAQDIQLAGSDGNLYVFTCVGDGEVILFAFFLRAYSRLFIE